MTSSSQLNGQAQAQLPSQRYARLVERYFKILVIMVTVGVLVLALRAVQLGPDLNLMLQLTLTLLVLGVLLVRRFLPYLLVIAVILASIFAFVLLGAYKFGLIEPALYLFIALPVASAVIWGIWTGVLMLAAVVVLLMLLAVKFVLIEPQLAFDADAYMQDPTNWAIFFVSLTVNALWCMLIVNLQRNFWIASLDELEHENERRLESERQRSEAKLRWHSVAENIPGILFDYLAKPDGKPVFENISNGCLEIWGLEPEAIHADPRLVLSRIKQEGLIQIQQSIADSARTLTPFSVRFESLDKNGMTKWMQMTGRPTPEVGGTLRWHCVALDISREVAAEQEAAKQAELAQQVQRQKSIGQLTGGVAHDFNNLLAVIVGTLELVREDPKAEEWYDLLDNAMEATRQGIDLTRNMLAFSRQAPLAPKVLDLNAVVSSTNAWFRRTLPANVTVEISLGQDLWPVRVDESSTVSALLNLVVNARDAMPQGGRITIETSNLEVDQEQADTLKEPIAPGRYVVITLSDTGTGMPPEVMAQVFEPFFTTKEVGAGTGLGLPMVQGFMKQSGGGVAVRSEPGCGTEFRLYFPIAQAADTAINVRQQKPSTVVSAGARLLVVEDEPIILSNLQRALTRLGYEVVTAANGDQAAALFKDDPSFDLMLTDIIMPGTLQGVALASEVRRINPDLPVVFMSGYSKDFADLDGGVGQKDPLLIKPVKREDLIATIEQQLLT